MYVLCELIFLFAGPGDASPIPSADLPSYGTMLLKTVLALIIVIGLAWVFLRWGLARLLPGRGHTTGEMRVLDRLPLDGRRQVVLVQAYGRYLLLGVGDGSTTLLTELDADAVAEVERRRAAQPQRNFAHVLRAALGKKPPDPEPRTPQETDTSEGKEKGDA